MIPELLKTLFGGTGSLAPAATPATMPGNGATDFESIIRQASGMMNQQSPEEQRREAIARGLAAFSKSIGSSEQDFLPALAGALPDGVTGFLDAKQKTAENQQKSARAALDDILAAIKAKDTSAYRGDMLDLRERLGLARIDQGDRRLDMTQDRYGVLERQGDVRLEQGQRIAIQAKKAELDVQKAAAEVANSGLKGENLRSTIIARGEKLKSEKAKELNLGDQTFKLVDPDGYAAAKAEHDAYSKAIDEKFKGGGGLTADPATSSPQPIPAPKAGTTPQVKYSETNPAKVTTQAELDALPPGSVFRNPSDGKLYRKKAQNGGPK